MSEPNKNVIYIPIDNPVVAPNLIFNILPDPISKPTRDPMLYTKLLDGQRKINNLNQPSISKNETELNENASVKEYGLKQSVYDILQLHKKDVISIYTLLDSICWYMGMQKGINFLFSVPLKIVADLNALETVTEKTVYECIQQYSFVETKNGIMIPTFLQRINVLVQPSVFTISEICQKAIAMIGDFVNSTTDKSLLELAEDLKDKLIVYKLKASPPIVRDNIGEEITEESILADIDIIDNDIELDIPTEIVSVVYDENRLSMIGLIGLTPSAIDVLTSKFHQVKQACSINDLTILDLLDHLSIRNRFAEFIAIHFQKINFMKSGKQIRYYNELIQLEGLLINNCFKNIVRQDIEKSVDGKKIYYDDNAFIYKKNQIEMKDIKEPKKRK